jgi:hypothetical protein
MEQKHSTLQRSDQKGVDEIKRIRSTLEAEESPLTEGENDTILECAKELGANGDSKL